MIPEERDYKALSKRNIFLENAREIRDICVREGVDVGVATEMWRDMNKLDREEGIIALMNEFLYYCKEDTLNVIVDKLA